MIGFHFRFKMVRINKSIRNQQTRSAYVIAIFRWPFLVCFVFNSAVAVAMKLQLIQFSYGN